MSDKSGRLHILRMNKRKVISVVLALLGMAIIGFAVLALIGTFKEQNAGVLVEANTNATVFINDKEVGKTPFETEMSSGEINLRIKPDVNDNFQLDDYETKLNLVSGIKTIVKRDFNENEELTSTAVVSFEKMGGQESLVTAVSIPDNAQVFVDNKAYGFTPLKINISAGDHELKLISDGFDEKKLSIKVYKGFKLTAAVKLSKENIEQNITNVVGVQDEVKKRQIRVNKNSVGFLRVREGASTGFPEVGQVKPDEVYDVIEEGEHGKWFKIQMNDEEGMPTSRQGWVSGEFVTKI